MKEEEQKSNIQDLMYHIQKEHYKEMCDQIKIAILDKLISLGEPTGIIEVQMLKAIREGVNNLRKKDVENETRAIVSVIDNLISRGLP